ncbi:MAG: HAD-IIB family hydrolase, partial [Clostridia bacterium]|nr:HAD-IIB family hydrolase [Clostridia bacterium]
QGYKVTHQLLSEIVKESKSQPVKVVVLADDEHCKKLVKEGREKFPHLAIMRSHQLVVEAITKGINKGEAIKWLCDKYGIDVSEAIAMGDSENDIEMIKAAGLGIAVGNAMPNVKQSADFVADTNDNDAVAQVIYQFCLNKD